MASRLPTLLQRSSPRKPKATRFREVAGLNRLRKNASLLSSRVLRCHSESFAVILSEAKNLALPAQDKLREGSRSVCSGLTA